MSNNIASKTIPTAEFPKAGYRITADTVGAVTVWRAKVLDTGQVSEESLSCDYDSLSVDIQRQLGLHGLKQKVGDSAAKAAGATLLEKLASMQSTISALQDGMWSRQSNEWAETRQAALLWKGYTPESAEGIKFLAWLDLQGADDAGKKKVYVLRDTKPEWRAAYDALKGRSGKADTSLLDELENL